VPVPPVSVLPVLPVLPVPVLPLLLGPLLPVPVRLELQLLPVQQHPSVPQYWPPFVAAPQQKNFPPQVQGLYTAAPFRPSTSGFACQVGGITCRNSFVEHPVLPVSVSVSVSVQPVGQIVVVQQQPHDLQLLH
jgi:hypothetical protein